MADGRLLRVPVLSWARDDDCIAVLMLLGLRLLRHGFLANFMSLRMISGIITCSGLIIASG